jgi:sarcosine oxidase subunit beta
MDHLGRVGDLIPRLRNVGILRAWAGTVARTPDGVPIVGPVEGIQGYVLAAGFCGHGFCLGPIMGKLLSELVLDGEPSFPLDAFRLERFRG